MPTEKELIDFAVEEEFLLFCDEDEFVQIAQAVLHKWADPADLAAAQEEAARLRAALDEIGGLCRYLRQSGPDPMDLESLSEALETAVNAAHNALKR